MRLTRFLKVKKAAVAIIIFTMCFVSACGNAPDNRVIVAGSTSVQPYAEIIAEEYALLHPENEVDVQGGGSSAGIAAAESGAADIGMSSRALNDKEQGFWSFEIARDGLAIIIHPDNPVFDLTLEQVRDIYTAKISDWSELGGPNAKIHIIAREDGSGTRSAFEELVMGDYFITPKAIIQDSNGAIRQLVSGDAHSIGFISAGLVDETVKYIKLNGFAPTRVNLMDGSYSLYRPFLFVTKGQPSGPARLFIDFALSPEGQQLLIEEGLISLADD